MLQIVNGIQIATDDYYIQHRADGCDELHFEISLADPAYAALNEESRILETTEHQTFTVKTISGSQRTAKIGCQLDLSDWQTVLHIGYNSQNRTAPVVLGAIKPSGWTVVNQTTSTKARQIHMEAPTPLEIAVQMQETFECAIRFNNARKTATLLYPQEQPLSNAYAVDTVNLRKPPEFKGKSSRLYTRLYPFGQETDGVALGIASVNGGKAYVECCDYTDKIICAVWKDARYTDAQSLKEDAQKRVNTAAVPERSWKLPIVDLYRIDPSRWPDMSIAMFTKLRLVDGNNGLTSNVQVVEDKVYPHYPEKNEVTVSTVTRSIQRTLRGVYDDINNPNSAFFQRLNAK